MVQVNLCFILENSMNSGYFDNYEQFKFLSSDELSMIFITSGPGLPYDEAHIFAVVLFISAIYLRTDFVRRRLYISRWTGDSF